MIYINRYRKDENGQTIEPSQTWFENAEVATERAIEEGANHRWNQGLYADPIEVKPTLEKLFHGKCAYCEGKLPEEFDGWDIEHFRPKGEVAERGDHPGYYWLGYKWENLYPSCKSCNQLRKDKPVWGDLRELPAQGKSYQFPLYDESTRAMSHNDDIYVEHTLLVDPCYDDPESYFGYDPKGYIFAPDQGNNPYGDRSIAVFNLKRRRLRDRRKLRMERVIKAMKIIKKMEDDGNKEMVNDFREFLEQMIADKSRYAGAGRFVVNNPQVFLDGCAL